MRRAARIDANQPEIVKTIRAMGASFQHTHQIPGALDGIIGYKGVDQRVEIKDPEKPPSARKLTELEEKEFAEWNGRTPVVIETIDDIVWVLAEMAASV